MVEETAAEFEDFCVYCGSVESLEDDHVPPKGIFPKPRPNSLITVRACKSCNHRASKDDEYFRMMLCLSQDVGESPEAQKNWAAVFRSLERPEAQGMTKAFLGRIHPVQAMTWSGIHLGKKIGFDVDLERINRVIARTVRGLYFHEWKQRLPEGYDVAVHCDETLIRLPPDISAEFQRMVILPMASVEPKIIAPGVFFYRFLVAEDSPLASAWCMTFYERKTFLAITGPKNPSGSPTMRK
jgi:hypothetical protein